jgi:hypothetical protein
MCSKRSASSRITSKCEGRLAVADTKYRGGFQVMKTLALAVLTLALGMAIGYHKGFAAGYLDGFTDGDAEGTRGTVNLMHCGDANGAFSGTDGISPNAKRPVLSFLGMDSARY